MKDIHSLQHIPDESLGEPAIRAEVSRQLHIHFFFYSESLRGCSDVFIVKFVHISYLEQVNPGWDIKS